MHHASSSSEYMFTAILSKKYGTAASVPRHKINSPILFSSHLQGIQKNLVRAFPDLSKSEIFDTHLYFLIRKWL